MSKQAAIKQPVPPAEEVPVDVLADQIGRIADAADALLSSRLKRRTLLLLIQHGCPSTERPTLNQIDAILTSAHDRAKTHLK